MRRLGLPALLSICGCQGILVIDPAIYTSSAGSETESAESNSDDAPSSSDDDSSDDGSDTSSDDNSDTSDSTDEGQDSGAPPDPDPDLPDDLPEDPLAGFVERSVELGLDAFHSDQGNTWLTPGLAWADFNRDGTLDVVVTSQLEPNHAFVGHPDGHFTIPAWAGQLALPEDISAGAVAGDYDNDGFLDLYLLAQGPNTLLRNVDGTGFEDVTLFAGVGDIGDGETANFADYDGDGHLDLYVANNDFDPPDVLYHNLGDGSFDEVSYLLSLDGRARPAFASVMFDYDRDGDPDIYKVSDKTAGNVLWRNDGPGCAGWCFTDVSLASGAGIEMFAMGVAVGDYDNDGDQDLFVSNIGAAVLLQNRSAQGDPVFIESAAEAGVLVDDEGWGEVSWGAQFLDFDNDGWLDLYVSIGKMDPGPSQPNCLFHNNTDGTFTKLDDVGGASDPRLSFAVGQADFNNDGWLDLLVGNSNDRYTLFENSGSGHHYLEVQLRSDDPSVNRDAIGAKVSLFDELGQVQQRELSVGGSIGSGSSLTLHFGLGERLPVAAKVVWPNGDQELLVDPPVDAIWALTKGP